MKQFKKQLIFTNSVVCNIPKPRRATHTVTFWVTAVWELMHGKREQQDGDRERKDTLCGSSVECGKKDSVGVI